MKAIKLDKGEWKYDSEKPLGRKGGFGIVFAGTGQGHDELAIKKLNIEAKNAAHRELTIAKDLVSRKLSHVIPVLDSGQDAESDSYFVVMALAEKSLQDEIDKGISFGDIEAASVLLQIAKGLLEVGDIVHRDIKPANVLFHEGKWKVADFGIARFVEKSTSLHTLKDYLTPTYAAPEQWRLERSTSATDVYALGCIGYTLIMGQPPFKGPNNEAFKYQHLNETPPQLKGHEPRLESLLAMMLRKAPEARPSLGRTKSILEEIIDKKNSLFPKTGLNSLAKAAAEVATREAEEEAQRKAEVERVEHRKCLAISAFNVLKENVDKMFDHILRSASAAKCQSKLDTPLLQGDLAKILERRGIILLGNAKLIVEVLRQIEVMIPENAFSHSRWDVVVGGIIRVEQSEPRYEWSSSLWYFRLPSDDNYRWREVSYFSTFSRGQGVFEPFALKEITEADKAASTTIDFGYQIAFGPKPIDDEDFESFCDRWADLLAKAAKGDLRHPRQLPLPD